MTDITLGQFIPGNSCIHRLDPRTKIVLMLVYIVMVFLVKSLVLFAVPLFYVLLSLRLGQISFSYFGKAIKPIRFLLVLMFLLNLFITPGKRCCSAGSSSPSRRKGFCRRSLSPCDSSCW